MKSELSPRRRGKSAVTERVAARGNGGLATDARSGVSHVTPAGGAIFADLGFSPEEAQNLKVRAQLMGDLRNVIADVTQVEAAALLGVTQPRVSDLKRGKIGMFTIDALVNMLAHAGITMRVSLSRRKKSAA